jgi:hypothetical protein
MTDPNVEQSLSGTVEALAKARITLEVLVKRWHREEEDKAIRYVLGQLDRAGILMSGLQNMVEGTGNKDGAVTL